jgi:transcriptional regulator with XRE-family HTH domain
MTSINSDRGFAMPWVPIRHALRKLREARGWSLQELEDECGVTVRSLTAIESRRPPSFVKPQNAEAISLAFDLNLNHYTDWPPNARWVVWKATRAGGGGDADVAQLPVHGTLSKAAQIERDLDLHALTLQTSGGPVALLGLDRLNKALSMPKAHADQVFAVSGNVDQHKGMPSSVSKRLGAPQDDGVIYRVTRAVSKRLPLYVTVFAPHAETSKALMDAYDGRQRVVMLVRVVYDPYLGPWRGFFWFEDEGTAKKFAFVVTKIVTETK